MIDLYTIGQISEMFGLPISTLRYYDREGLFPGMRRQSGIRLFGEQEVDALRVIECLKASGLEIREIKRFMEWCAEGPATYPRRKALFESRKAAVESEIQRLHRILDMLNYKCWYYGKACEDGTEENILAMLPDGLPPEIQALYDRGRKAPLPESAGAHAEPQPGAAVTSAPEPPRRSGTGPASASGGRHR